MYSNVMLKTKMNLGNICRGQTYFARCRAGRASYGGKPREKDEILAEKESDRCRNRAHDKADAAATPELLDSNTADTVPLTLSIADDLQGPRVSEDTGHEQAIGSRVEVGQDQTRSEEHRIPGYDFRPLPGRNCIMR
jgi:hypothetical protein